MERATFEDRARATARQRTTDLARLREAAFGPGGLFRISVPEPLPVPLADVPVPELDGLPAGSAAASWRHLVAEEGAVALPAVAGLVNKNNTCYALSLLQVLLRLPPVAIWLQWHYSRCDANLTCVACRTWASRWQLGSDRTQPVLVTNIGLVSRRFADRSQQDADDFLGALLHAMRDREVLAGRSTPWLPGPDATHVDRLFGYVLETRRRCAACGHVRCTCERHFSLHLPPPPADEAARVYSVTELFYRAAAEELVPGVKCSSCGRHADARRQQRVAYMPNVLLLRVARGRGAGPELGLSRHSVVPELELSFPAAVMAPSFGEQRGSSTMELAAVVYHQGRSQTSGHYFATVKFDGRWYRFDDRVVRLYTGDLERELLGYVYLLVYVRPRGEAHFAGMGALVSPSAPSGPSSAIGEAQEMLSRWDAEAWLARLRAFLARFRPGHDRASVTLAQAEAAREAVCGGDASALGSVFAALLGDEAGAPRLAHAFDSYMRKSASVLCTVGRAAGRRPSGTRGDAARVSAEAAAAGSEAVGSRPAPRAEQGASAGAEVSSGAPAAAEGQSAELDLGAPPGSFPSGGAEPMPVGQDLADEIMAALEAELTRPREAEPPSEGGAPAHAGTARASSAPPQPKRLLKRLRAVT